MKVKNLLDELVAELSFISQLGNFQRFEIFI
jgi:hypothetical protein